MKTKDDLLAEIRAERAAGTPSSPRSARGAWSGRGRWAIGPSKISPPTSPAGGSGRSGVSKPAPAGEPPTPWPGHLTGDDAINAWIYERNRDRSREVLAEADASFARLAAAVAALPDEDLTAPGRFAWLEGQPLVAADFFGHLHEEHEPSIRAWLARA